MVRNRQRLFQRGAWQHNRKFFTAVTRGDVLALDGLLQRHCDQPQDLVTGQVSKVVVEQLEVVDVEHQE